MSATRQLPRRVLGALLFVVDVPSGPVRIVLEAPAAVLAASSALVAALLMILVEATDAGAGVGIGVTTFGVDAPPPMPMVGG